MTESTIFNRTISYEQGMTYFSLLENYRKKQWESKKSNYYYPSLKSNWWNDLDEFISNKFDYKYKDNFNQFYIDILSVSQSYTWYGEYNLFNDLVCKNLQPDTAHYLSILTNSYNFDRTRYLEKNISTIAKNTNLLSFINELSRTKSRSNNQSYSQIHSETYGNVAIDYVRKLFNIPIEDDTKANMGQHFETPFSVLTPFNLIVFSSPYLEDRNPEIFTGTNTLAIYRTIYSDFRDLGMELKKCSLSPTDITVLEIQYNDDSIFTNEENTNSVFSLKLDPKYDIDINDCNLFISEFNEGHIYKSMCDIPRYDNLSSVAVYKPQSLGHFRINYTNHYNKFVSKQANKVILNYFQRQLPYLSQYHE